MFKNHNSIPAIFEVIAFVNFNFGFLSIALLQSIEASYFKFHTKMNHITEKFILQKP